MENLIVQSDSFDMSTDSIISWLHYLKPDIEIVKLFDEHQIKDITLKLSNNDVMTISINGLNITESDHYWYRRGRYSFDNFLLDATSSEFEKKIAKDNLTTILDFVHNIQFKNGINKYSDNKVDKLKMLNYCRKHSIIIPDTLVTNSIEHVNDFLKKHKRIISKPIQYPIVEFYENQNTFYFATKTHLITKDIIVNFPQKFLPSFFQKYVDKLFEIRSFYLKGNFYSMAIFSQENEKTKIDFRDYDYERPNRIIPFNLPKKIEKKLKKLMEDLNINSGSLDIIYTPQNEFVFLEVNPVGQFQWLSYYCNYFMEREIAKNLSNVK
ncbi:MAG: grasp-with-spasm system ATP-grasp peptide maturase [Saprospiraceae bacterium]